VNFYIIVPGIIAIIQIAESRFEGDNIKLVWLLPGIIGLVIYKVAGPEQVK
jgi:hypothetical protein